MQWDENTVRENSTIVYASPKVSHGSKEGSWSNMKYNGNYLYTVVTKHRRDSAIVQGGDQWATVSNEAVLHAKWRSGYIEDFRVSASTSAYIPPVGTGPASFQKYIPNKDDNDAHFIHGGQELVTNREAAHMPVFPYEITYTENTNSDNPAWNSGTKTCDAPKRTMTLTDGVTGDVVISSNEDNYATDTWANSEALYDDDYHFDALNIKITKYDAEMLGGQWSNPYVHSDYHNYEDTQIWIRRAHSNDFTLYKTLHLAASETIVRMPENTVGFKLVHSSEFYSTNIAVKTNICLNPTA